MPDLLYFERDGVVATERWEGVIPAKEAQGWSKVTPAKAVKVEAAQGSDNPRES